MKRLLFIFVLVLSVATGWSQQQRLIVYGGLPWFSFDPLTNGYQKSSLAQLWGYASAWREELGDDNLILMAHPDFEDQMPRGYKLYLAASGDSTMLDRLDSYMGVSESVSSDFSLDRYLPDTIARGKVLVIDKWDFFGEVSLKTKMVDISEFPNSPEFLTDNDRDVQRMRRYFSTPIAVIDTVYSTEDCYFGASHLAGLFHRFQLATSGADLSVYAPSREQFSWAQGELYLKDIYQMLPFDNDLCLVTVSGALVLEFLQECYSDRYYTVKRESDDMVRLRAPYYLHSSLAGVDYMVNLTKPRGKRIENCTIDAGREYRLAVNSFGARWFSEHGCMVDTLGDYRIGFVQWLGSQDSLDGLESVEQWRTIPEELTRKVARREKETLFE